MRPRLRLSLSAFAALGLSTLLAACASSANSTAPTAGAFSPVAQPVAVAAVEADPTWGHVHQVVYDLDEGLTLGTHGGVIRIGSAGAQFVGEVFDVMGLTRTADGWLASGHPSPGADALPDLGLLTSPDAANWSTVSLGGEIDFHRLAAGGEVVAGIAAHDGLLHVSVDGGQTWSVDRDLRPADVAVSGDGATIVVTTKDGPMRSVDGGASFTAISGAPLIGIVTWANEGFWGITPEGVIVFGSTDGTWRETRSLGEPAGGLAVRGDRIAVLMADRILESKDGGDTFQTVVTGLGH